VFALSRSSAFPDTRRGLGFLGPAVVELVDETDALVADLKNLGEPFQFGCTACEDRLASDYRWGEYHFTFGMASPQEPGELAIVSHP
jgi:hypothetical protein